MLCSPTPCMCRCGSALVPPHPLLFDAIDVILCQDHRCLAAIYDEHLLQHRWCTAWWVSLHPLDPITSKGNRASQARRWQVGPSTWDELALRHWRQVFLVLMVLDILDMSSIADTRRFLLFGNEPRNLARRMIWSHW
jgi:hypothetical protein